MKGGRAFVCGLFALFDSGAACWAPSSLWTGKP